MARRHRSSPFSLFSFQDIITSVTGIIILLTLILALELVTRKPSAQGGSSPDNSEQLRESIAEAAAESAQLEEALEKRTARVQELAAASPQQLAREKRDVEQEVQRLEAEVQQLVRQAETTSREKKEAVAKSEDRELDRKELKQREATLRSLAEKLKDLKRKDHLIYNLSRDAGKRAWLVDVSPDKLAAAPLGEAVPPTVFEESSAFARARSFIDFTKRRDPKTEYFVFLIRPAAVETFADIRLKLEGSGFDIGFDVIGSGQTVLDPKTGASIR
ncbi:MAG: hypothetical protein HYX69_17895 [Planctomycetia bacterium]|nr:hypothetical protein [Planctomycetia bacterium]